jgi:two-component system, LytTR family, response regulator
MINCVIVDDEQNAVEVLKRYVLASGLLHLAYTTTSALDALQFINTQPVDLVFLDIDMPEMNGLELAKAIRGRCKVVFTTAHSEFVSDAFDLDADVVDYLLKPVPLPRFIRAVKRAIDSIGPIDGPPIADWPQEKAGTVETDLEYDYIFIRGEQRHKVQKIELAEIDYIEAMRNYMAIYHCGQKTMALLTMKEMEATLPQRYFVRVHKSFIVALYKIATVTKNKLTLKNRGVEIPIGEAMERRVVS